MSVVIGIFLGFTIGYFKYLRDSMTPLVFFLFSLPKIPLLPLFILWFGSGLNLRISYGFTLAVFPILINIIQAIKEIDPTYFSIARSLGAGTGKIYTKILIPAIFPALLAGLRLGFSSCVVGVIIPELFIGRWGIGSLVSVLAATFRVVELYAVIITFSLFTVAINILILYIERRSLKWSE